MDKKELIKIVADKHLLYLETKRQFAQLDRDDQTALKSYLNKLREDYLEALKLQRDAKG